MSTLADLGAFLDATNERKIAVALLLRERQEQIVKHGFDDAHDDKTRGDGELAHAAATYAVADMGPGAAWHFWPFPIVAGDDPVPRLARKPRLEQLAIAGALIVAEMERLLRHDPDVLRASFLARGGRRAARRRGDR